MASFYSPVDKRFDEENITLRVALKLYDYHRKLFPDCFPIIEEDGVEIDPAEVGPYPRDYPRTV